LEILVTFLILVALGIFLDKITGLFPLFVLIGIVLWFIALFKRMNRKNK